MLLLRELAGVDGGRDTGISFTQHYKCILINVVVDEHDGGLLDEADDVGVGIKDLAVVEDTLHGRQRRAHEEINFVLQSLYLSVLFGYVLFQCNYTVVYYISFQKIIF